MKAIRLVSLAALLSAGLTACGGDGGDRDGLQVMIGSSGEAETAAVTAAAKRFTEKTGTKVEVIPAQNLVQQLTQGFAGGEPPDLFYLSPGETRQFSRSLHAYGDEIADLDDFVPELLEPYKVDGEQYCVPKDGNTMALVVNTTAWQAAGLTEADYPKTWADLTAVSQKLTTGGQVGLAFDGKNAAVSTFLVQGGGWYVNDDMTKATANSPENTAALTYLQDNLVAGNFAFLSKIEAKSAAEALGTGKAAMIIDGGWTAGTLSVDFPDTEWQSVALPAGPGGAGTMQFSNCWGVAAKSADTAAAVDLVEHFTSPEEQQTFAMAFGVNPSRQSLQEWNATQRPEAAPFAAYEASRAPVPLPSFTSVLTDFDAQLEQLATGAAKPADILDQLQANEEAALKEET
jgi:multiple sugar transport system substrate-binding protein